MRTGRLSEGFGIFLDATKTTSGQRFFMQLGAALESRCRPLEQRPRTVLFNISAPWLEIVRAKLRGQKVVLRVDGLYFDLPTDAFLRRFSAPMAALFRAGLARPHLHDFACDVANFLDSNFAGFLRIGLADFVIYQSRFSHRLHQRYFAGKESCIVVNGSHYVAQPARPERNPHDPVRLVTIYDDWKPSKRIYDVLRFVEWLVNVRHMNVELTVLGYTGRIPASYPADARTLLEQRAYIKTLPRFSAFEGDIAAALLAADCYVSFSFRDPCPNAVIEAMAHGLPVLGVASGGLPDIVGDSGLLLPADDFECGFFSAHRFENHFPAIDFPAMCRLLDELLSSLPEFRQRVRRRFETQLSIAASADRYAAALSRITRHGWVPTQTPLGDGGRRARP